MRNMDTMAAFMMGEANRGSESKVFDWHKAAREIKERGAKEAHAGLSEDWGATNGCIVQYGRPVTEDAYVYLASTWATPVLVIGEEEIPCWKKQSEVPEWDEHTCWPDSALEILGKGRGSGTPEIEGYTPFQDLIAAMTWLLDDLGDAGEDRAEGAEEDYDSVANAKRALARARGEVA